MTMIRVQARSFLSQLPDEFPGPGNAGNPNVPGGADSGAPGDGTETPRKRPAKHTHSHHSHPHQDGVDHPAHARHPRAGHSVHGVHRHHHSTAHPHPRRPHTPHTPHTPHGHRSHTGHLSPTHRPHQRPSASAHPPFETGENLGSVQFNGTAYAKQKLNPSIDQAAAQLSNAQFKVVPAAMAVSPSVLPNFKNVPAQSMVQAGDQNGWDQKSVDEQKWLNFLHDALMVAVDKGNLSPKLEPSKETMAAEKITAREAPAALAACLDTNPDASASQGLAHNLTHALISAGFRAYNVAWQGSGGAACSGLVAVNPKSGEVRIIAGEAPV